MMIDLARLCGRSPLSLSEIAKHEVLQVSHLDQLASKLRKAGLISSRRDAHD
ncbi:MAG: hypothetical protein DLM70_03780 [Chloroflexi bacterium]|nr:MAG: hypothetical protein DLM70_03780 [Chloroflexota bacterium]